MAMMVSVMLVIGIFSLPRFRLRGDQWRNRKGHDRQSHYNSFHDIFWISPHDVHGASGIRLNVPSEGYTFLAWQDVTAQGQSDRSKTRLQGVHNSG